MRQDLSAEERSKTIPTLGWILALYVVGQILVSVLFDLPFEPVDGGDTGRYVSAGETFPNLTSVQWGYVGYCFIHFLDALAGADQWLVFVIQNLAVIIAARQLWDLIARRSNSLAGFIGAAFFLVNPLLAQWTRYMLTDSLFYVGVITLMSALVGNHSKILHPHLIAGIVMVGTIRPNGTILIPVVASILIVRRFGRRPTPLVLASLLCAALLAGVASLPTFQSGGGGSQNSFVQRAAKGEVFWNSEEQSLSMPTVAEGADSNSEFVAYVLKHPIDILKLGASRVAWETAQVRPWYSQSLNVFATFSSLILFVGLIVGYKRGREAGITAVMLALTIPSILLVAATWAIHEGRFGWWYMVTWIPVAAIGLQMILSKITDRVLSR